MEDKVYTDEEICAKCVDENEVLFDYEEEFVQKLVSVDISCPEQLTQEVMKNITKCSTVLLMFMKQGIISTQPRVRYHPDNGVYGLREKIFGTGVSAEVRDFFQSMSEIGCRILEESGMMDILVELDSERPGKVVAFGKTLKMAGYADILVCTNKDPRCKLAQLKQPSEHNSTEISESSATTNSQSTSGIVNLSNSMESSGRHKRSTRTAARRKVSQMNGGSKCGMSKDAAAKDGKGKSYSNGHSQESKDSEGEAGTVTAVVTVVVTGRNHLNVTAIYKQLLLSYLHSLSKFYFLVLHVGPLVDKQEIALYEYVPSKKLTDLIASYDGKALEKEVENALVQNQFVVSLTVQKTSSLKPPSTKETISDQNYLDVNELEMCFRKVMGRRIHKAAGLSQYFKYLFSDCPGVKDHHEDKKNRYERYVAKKEEKKQKKRQSRENRISKDKTPLPGHHNEVTFEFSTMATDEVQY